ncbi:hypothetical protein BO83DRAFT_233432 [Aspergillus eucalypticola CBS 122712]|uniref:Transmembrane protein n=1 Tax=Aspergillus eucalypticola (strain CBS 122712 / IBT 29274) TaxID=1448314 RepID=A0A317VRI8_ASPEC|nr:uncharacterized protein BO83DRAFT_233432 [Aspergillus eucalypticola CBS 122712]PWY76575.1 hypothetical protein BO83DRAFT_233432 [Aspergillus eucalypticola CBS 122712]
MEGIRGRARMKGVASSCVYYLPPAFLFNVFFVSMCFGFLSCLMLYSLFCFFLSLSFVTEKGSMVLFDCPISYILRLGWLQILAAVRDTPAVLELVSFFFVTPDGGWLICLDAHPWSAPRCSIRRLCTCSIHYAACIFFLYLVLEPGGQGGRLKTPCIRPGGSRHLWEATESKS